MWISLQRWVKGIGKRRKTCINMIYIVFVGWVELYKCKHNRNGRAETQMTEFSPVIGFGVACNGKGNTILVHWGLEDAAEELGKYILTRGHAQWGKTHPRQKERHWVSWRVTERRDATRMKRGERESGCVAERNQYKRAASIVRVDTMTGVRSQRWGGRSTAGELTGS